MDVTAKPSTRRQESVAPLATPYTVGVVDQAPIGAWNRYVTAAGTNWQDASPSVWMSNASSAASYSSVASVLAKSK